MSIFDIINPWGALREARGTIYALRCRLSEAAEYYQADIRLRDMENTILTEKIKRGHFRNPATGRLGKRGVTFE